MRARIGVLLVLAFGCVSGLPGVARAAALIEVAPAGTAAWPTGAPIHVGAPLGDPRVFVVERGGAVRIVKDGVVQPTPFVTVPNIDAAPGTERGLLSIAFPWDYATTGKFYVFAVIAGSQTYVRVLEYRVSSNADIADPTTQRTVLEQPMMASNHNGGQLAFSPTDGLLYITIGDNAVSAYAQNPEEQRGKVLRIDPADPDGDGPQTYTVPATNPEWPIATPTPRTVKNAVYAMGLRNPYRASFTPDGRFVIGDVGQSTTEEIDILPAGGGGTNFGWPTCEGPCTTPTPGLTDPHYTYPNVGGSQCSVIGGVTVRDAALTALNGRYLFADLCGRELRTINLDGAPDHQQVGISAVGNSYTLYSFGEDARGCVYVASGGALYRLAPTAGDPKACGQPFLPAPPAYKPPTQPDPGAGGNGAQPPPPGSSPAPAPTPPTTTKPNAPTKVTYPKNCTRDGRISIRVTGGKVTSVKLIRGKKTKTLKFKRVSGRLQLSGVPKSGRAKLRISVRVKSGRTVKVTKTYKPCKA